MEIKDIKWCPQHGYPLPCYKCGMSLAVPQQEEIYKMGKHDGIREVVEWIEDNWEIKRIDLGFATIELDYNNWRTKLQEWNIEDKKED